MTLRALFDELMEAVTFAEAGETDTARDIASRLFPSHATGVERQILALGVGAFSPALIETSISLAQRLGYGVLALSVAPRPRRFWGSRPATPAKSQGSAAEFSMKARELGIPFAEAVHAGDPQRIALEVTRHLQRIALLVVDSAAQRLPLRFEQLAVPVFAIGPGPGEGP